MGLHWSVISVPSTAINGLAMAAGGLAKAPAERILLNPEISPPRPKLLTLKKYSKFGVSEELVADKLKVSLVV